MITTTEMPVKLTTGAMDEIKRIYKNNSATDKPHLRIGVKGGGCAGLSYIMEMDSQGPQDELFELEGVSCIINKAHSMYLFGMEIDWKNGLDARGFVFNNPNASSTCGCGTSFAV